MSQAEYAEIDELRYNFEGLEEDSLDRRANQTEVRAGRGPDKPGVYPGEIVSMKARTKKANGDATKDIEVIAAISSGDFKGWQGRLYINADPESEYYDLNREIYFQVLNSIGLVEKSKKKGKFKIADAEGKACALAVTIEADNRPEREGQKQARLQAILKPGSTSADGAASTAAEPSQTGGDEDLPF